MLLAVLFMVFSPLAVAVAVHAMRGMYLHAERLLAKAGRQGAREGYLPPAGRAGASDFSQKNYGDTLVAAPGQRPQRGLASLCVGVNAQRRTEINARALALWFSVQSSSILYKFLHLWHRMVYGQNAFSSRFGPTDLQHASYVTTC
jgi:hypothetical protein